MVFVVVKTLKNGNCNNDMLFYRMGYAHKFLPYTFIFTSNKCIYLYQLRSYLLFFFLFVACFLRAQTFPLQLVFSDSLELDKIKTIKVDHKAGVPSALTPVIDQMISKDYLEAGLDSITFDSTQGMFNCFIHVGPQYHFTNFNLDSLSQAVLNEADFEIPQSPNEFIELRKEIIRRYGDNGFPFARIRLKDIRLNNGAIIAKMQLNKGPLITIDSIRMHGDVKLRYGYLENYLGIQNDMHYDHSLVSGVSDKIEKLSFLELEKDPKLGFFYNYASLDLYVKAKNSSRFDLLFGVIPTSNIADQQLFLSLDFTAEMLNRMGYGEYIYIDFERLRPEQQRFELRFNYPYLLDLPFAFDLDFSIFRNSLDYQTIHSDLGVQYLLGNLDYLKVGWNLESSRLVDVDTIAIKNTGTLPQDLDVDLNGLAIEAYFNKLDYRFNPRKGFELRV